MGLLRVHLEGFLLRLACIILPILARPGQINGPVGNREISRNAGLGFAFFYHEEDMEFLPIKRALLSVTDKSGLKELAGFLADNGVELVSTGGTRKMLMDAGIPVTSVSDVTGFPEILGGRVKTLHPHVHAGVLADKDDPAHMATLADLDLTPFDLICVNLYDFARAVEKAMDLKAAVEQIDIGGPTLLRAGAKNFHSMTVLPDIADYPAFMDELKANGFKVSLGFRKDMAVKTFGMISGYDRMISEYLGRGEL